jgi:hypothetical protein
VEGLVDCVRAFDPLVFPNLEGISPIKDEGNRLTKSV